MGTGTLFANLPAVRRRASTQWGRRVKAGLGRAFPEWSPERLTTEYRRLASSEFANRVIFRFHNRFPKAASFVARFVPVMKSAAFDELLSTGRPLIIAASHLGPVFFVLLVARLAFRDRIVYCLHAERAANGPLVEKFMHAIDVVPVLDEPMAMRQFIRALHDEPRTVVVVAFDHLAAGNRRTPFLATEIPASDGIGYLAEQSEAVVATLMVRFERGRLRLVFDGPVNLDKTLPRGIRRRELVDRLHRILAPYVAAAPDQWSEWAYVALDVD